VSDILRLKISTVRSAVDVYLLCGSDRLVFNHLARRAADSPYSAFVDEAIEAGRTIAIAGDRTSFYLQAKDFVWE
jgi:hypothetical protein